MTDNDIVTLAFRRVLAELTRDYEAWGVTADDVGACPHCWQRIAYELAQIHAGHLCMHHGSEDTPHRRTAARVSPVPRQTPTMTDTKDHPHPLERSREAHRTER